MSLTLRSRVIFILTIFVIVTIAVFIAIQLAHELNMLNEYNAYKGKLVSLVVKERIERVLNLPAPQEEKRKLLEETISSLKRTKLVKKLYILNKQGDIFFSTEEWLKESKGDYDDLAVVNKIKIGQRLSENAIVNKTTKILSLYIPLSSGGEINNVARVFFSLGDIWGALKQIYKLAMILGLALIFINTLLGIFLSRLVVGPINVFNKAAKVISEGRLDLRVKIHTDDELEELANTFNSMTQELAKMKAQAENANPLTKLPGNIVIMEEAEAKIKAGKKFTVIYCDLDNFKAFNDKYGIHKGDEAIQLTGNIFKEAVKAKGNPDDFVGHEGGDDFILLTTPEKAEGIAQYVMDELDKRSKALYNEEDLQQGYIIAHARDGSTKEFPLMSISLAGVTNQHRPIENYAEITNIAAILKKKAKKETKSCYVADERKD